MAGLAGLFEHRDPTWLSECMTEGCEGGSPEALFHVALVLGLGQLPGCVGLHLCTVGPLRQGLAKLPGKNVSYQAPVRMGHVRGAAWGQWPTSSAK